MTTNKARLLANEWSGPSVELAQLSLCEEYLLSWQGEV